MLGKVRGYALRCAAGVLAVGALLAVSAVRVNAAWEPIFSESFDSGRLPDGCVRFDKAAAGPAASYYRPDEVSVADGRLHLAIRRRDYGGRSYTAGGLGCPALVQRYGRYEFSARAPHGVGIDAFAALAPVDERAVGDTSLVEIRARPGAERLYLSTGDGPGIVPAEVPGSYSDDFHTYVLEWSPAGYRVLVDGHEVFADKRVVNSPRWLCFGVTSGDALTGVPDTATGLPAEFLVDYVRVYAYDGTAWAPSPSPTGERRPPSAPSSASRSGGGGWAVRLAGGAVVLLLVAGAVALVRRGRPRRPGPAHRA